MTFDEWWKKYESQYVYELDIADLKAAWQAGFDEAVKRMTGEEA